jgi:hypothetical protein
MTLKTPFASTSKGLLHFLQNCFGQGFGEQNFENKI